MTDQRKIRMLGQEVTASEDCQARRGGHDVHFLRNSNRAVERHHYTVSLVGREARWNLDRQLRWARVEKGCCDSSDQKLNSLEAGGQGNCSSRSGGVGQIISVQLCHSAWSEGSTYDRIEIIQHAVRNKRWDGSVSHRSHRAQDLYNLKGQAWRCGCKYDRGLRPHIQSLPSGRISAARTVTVKRKRRVSV